jgi:hypothetical protein
MMEEFLFLFNIKANPEHEAKLFADYKQKRRENARVWIDWATP